MNILLLTHETDCRDGWATTSFQLVEHLSKKHRVTTLTRAELGKPVFLGPIGLLRYRWRLRKLRGPFDLVLCNVEPYLPLAVLLKLRFSARLLLTAHGTYGYYPFMRGWQRFWRRACARFVDRIMVPSVFTRDRLREWWPGEVMIQRWGVDSTRFHPVESGREPAFVFVGEQKERKGLFTLLRAFRKLVDQHPHARLYLVGSAKSQYRDAVRALRLDEQVIFTGRVDHAGLLGYYSRCLAHVLPSRNTDDAFEGFGLVHLEANACGIPSIGSTGTANEEVIAPGVSGFLIAPDDVDGLCQQLCRLIEDPALAARLRAGALQHARANTWDQALQSLDAILPVRSAA